MKDILSAFAQTGIIPVVVLDDAADAAPLAEALYNGGLPCAEVTFRTPAAAQSIKNMLEHCPDLFVGAGTVLNEKQVLDAKEAGAKFLVSPGLNPRTLDAAVKAGVPMLPGVCTPSEIEQALERGLTHVKFFPAEPSGGLKMIKALAAPYTETYFMPTGGINLSNVREYLSYDKVFCVGGSWMVPKDLIREKKFEEIEKLVREAALLKKEIRP